jgi:nicotinate-nucleotide pyrophosphorylase (carboxylating)
VKDNHIDAAGSLSKAVALARAGAPHVASIEVETRSLREVAQALRAGADVILLDNMPPALIRRAVALVGGAAVVEVSGGIRLDNVAGFAIEGVDVISVGALTHSAPAADLGLALVRGR